MAGFIPFMEPSGQNLFQHDNAPVYKASSLKTWSTKIGSEELDWPSQSPDLNLNEHLCNKLERQLSAPDLLI